MKLTFWGVRGSLSSGERPDEELVRLKNLLTRYEQLRSSSTEAASDQFIDNFLKNNKDLFSLYGSHTICLEVATAKHNIFIDGGSGMLRLASKLLQGPCGQGKGEINIFFTHFHWDHIVGLPFFTPFYIKGNKINLYAVQPELEDIIKLVFTKPMFPVPFDVLPSTIKFHTLKPREKFRVGDIELCPYALDHPDPCWGYKITDGKGTFSHCVDTSATRVSDKSLGPDLPLYQNTDLMIFDAQYSFEEQLEKLDWGHSSANIGIDIGLKRKIPRIVFIHHDPLARPNKIRELEQLAMKYYNLQLKSLKKQGREVHEIDITFGHEGLIVEV